MSSWLGSVTLAPPDAVFGVGDAFRRDGDPRKMNLSVGAYRDAQGRPYVLPVVRRAEERLLAAHGSHEYLPMAGLAELRAAAPRLLLGAEDEGLLGRTACLQTLSGTGALRVAGELLRQYHASGAVYVTEPTWGNHVQIFEKAGFEVRKLRYYDPRTRGLALEHYLADIAAAPDGSILVLHACAHNPTGVDPTEAQWAQIEQAVAQRHHTVIFDSAYQGYASGSVERDAAAIRYFVARGHQVLICQSFAKNMGLYGERVGTVSVVCSSPDQAKAVESRLQKVVRPMYSNPPKYGASVAATILNTPELYEQWLVELKGMADRIIDMRRQLYEHLIKLGTPGDWTHITSQIGMFTYTGLTTAQVEHLTREFHIYLLSSGRISMAGLNESNVERLAVAMDDAIRKLPSQKL